MNGFLEYKKLQALCVGLALTKEFHITKETEEWLVQHIEQMVSCKEISFFDHASAPLIGTPAHQFLISIASQGHFFI